MGDVPTEEVQQSVAAADQPPSLRSLGWSLLNATFGSRRGREVRDARDLAHPAPPAFGETSEWSSQLGNWPRLLPGWDAAGTPTRFSRELLGCTASRNSPRDALRRPECRRRSGPFGAHDRPGPRGDRRARGRQIWDGWRPPRSDRASAEDGGTAAGASGSHWRSQTSRAAAPFCGAESPTVRQACELGW